jgi:hypothetical protein
VRYKPPFQPWDLPEFTNAELAAFKALKAGVANQGQQVMALSAIIVKVCSTYDLSFRPGGPEADRATVFAEGKRFVGTRILEAISRPVATKKDYDHGTGAPAAKSTATAVAEATRRRNPKPTSGTKPAKPEPTAEG